MQSLKITLYMNLEIPYKSIYKSHPYKYISHTHSTSLESTFYDIHIFITYTFTHSHSTSLKYTIQQQCIITINEVVRVWLKFSEITLLDYKEWSDHKSTHYVLETKQKTRERRRWTISFHQHIMVVGSTMPVTVSMSPATVTERTSWHQFGVHSISIFFGVFDIDREGQNWVKQ